MARPTLTAAEVASLKQSQRKLNEYLPVFDDMEACGKDCQAFRQLFAQQNQQITELLNRFSPKNPLL